MKRKILSIFVCMLMIFSCVAAPISSASAASRAAYILKVNADYARLRTGTGSGSAIVDTLRKGEKVLFGGEVAGELCKVYTTDGRSGYTYRNYLSIYGAISKNRLYYTPAAAGLYVRSGSSVKKIGTVPRNQFVMVMRVIGEWAYVRSVNGGAGFMQTSTLKRAF